MTFNAKIDTLVLFSGEFGEQASPNEQLPVKYSKTITGLTTKRPIETQLNAVTKVLWDGTTDPILTSFSLLFLVADGELDLEFTCNEGDPNEEMFVLRLQANLPLALADGVSYYNHLANDALGSTADEIDKIRVIERNATPVTLRGWIAA